MNAPAPRPMYVRWVLWGLVAVLVCGFLALARWQMQRADVKQTLLDQQWDRLDRPAVLLTSFNGGIDEGRYLPVIVEGRAEGQYQFLLDNRIQPGQGAGYWVLMPVSLDSGATVLVNRGWVRATGYREQLPDVYFPPGVVRFQAYLNAYPEPGIKLAGADVPTAGWPAVVQWVDAAHIQQRLGVDVLPYQAVLKPGQPGVLEAVEPTLPMGPEKHYGYAFQWAALALALLLLSAWAEWRSRHTTR